MLIRFCSLINLNIDLLNKFNFFVSINILILSAQGRVSNTRFGQFICLNGANMTEVMTLFSHIWITSPTQWLSCCTLSQKSNEINSFIVSLVRRLYIFRPPKKFCNETTGS